VFISSCIIPSRVSWEIPRRQRILKDGHVQNIQVPCPRYLGFSKNTVDCLFSTVMELSVEQITKCYGARWKIESGFKEIKQNIGSSKSQARNAHAVVNHINFSMMAATITWIYGARLENTPERRHKVKGRSSFAFSDLRHIIAKVVLSGDFNAVFTKEQKLPPKIFCGRTAADGLVIEHGSISVKLQIIVYWAGNEDCFPTALGSGGISIQNLDWQIRKNFPRAGSRGERPTSWISGVLVVGFTSWFVMLCSP